MRLRDTGAQRTNSSPWQEKVNGVPRSGQEEGRMWLYHYSRPDVTLKISHSIGTGSFPSKGLETRIESKTLHIFTILETSRSAVALTHYFEHVMMAIL